MEEELNYFPPEESGGNSESVNVQEKYTPEFWYWALGSLRTDADVERLIDTSIKELKQKEAQSKGLNFEKIWPSIREVMITTNFVQNLKAGIEQKKEKGVYCELEVDQYGFPVLATHIKKSNKH